MSKKIKLGMIGGGFTSFIGIVHRSAANISESYEITGGVFDADFERARAFGEEMGYDVSRIYRTVEEFVENENVLPEGERIEAVTIITPNHLHFEAARKLLIGGFHVISDKPITITSGEALELESLVDEYNAVFAVTHTYTGYPMVREMKEIVANATIGKIQRVDCQYYQGWMNPLIHDVERRKSTWRLDPKISGISSCLGDIGVHAFNMIEYTTGLEISEVLADLNTLYSENPLDVDGTVMIRTADQVKGVIRLSQIATGEENNLRIAIYGSKGSLKWEQENPNYLYHLKEGEPYQVLKPSNTYNTIFGKESARIGAPGHPEGIMDSMANIYHGVAKAIRGEEYHKGSFPTIRDGVRGMQFIEAAVKSGKENQIWVTIENMIK